MSGRTLLFFNEPTILVDVEFGECLVELADFELDCFFKGGVFAGANFGQEVLIAGLDKHQRALHGLFTES